MAVLLAALLTAACGQKGPLYLPEDEDEDGAPPAEAAPAPASKGAAAQDTGG